MALVNIEQVYNKNFNVRWWFQELMLAFRYRNKERYGKALEQLKSFLDGTLYDFYLEFYEHGIWRKE